MEREGSRWHRRCHRSTEVANGVQSAFAHSWWQKYSQRNFEVAVCVRYDDIRPTGIACAASGARFRTDTIGVAQTRGPRTDCKAGFRILTIVKLIDFYVKRSITINRYFYDSRISPYTSRWGLCRVGLFPPQADVLCAQETTVFEVWNRGPCQRLPGDHSARFLLTASKWCLCPPRVAPSHRDSARRTVPLLCPLFHWVLDESLNVAWTGRRRSTQGHLGTLRGRPSQVPPGTHCAVSWGAHLAVECVSGRGEWSRRGHWAHPWCWQEGQRAEPTVSLTLHGGGLRTRETCQLSPWPAQRPPTPLHQLRRTPLLSQALRERPRHGGLIGPVIT